MKISNILTLGALSILMAGMSACKSEPQNLLETIPADAAMVAMIDGKTLCTESGIAFNKGTAEYPSPFGTALSENVRNSIDMMARLDGRGIADMGAVAMIVDNGGNTFVTFGINEFESFSEACGDRIAWADDSEGMHTGSMGSTSVVASDAQVWLTDMNPGAAKGVKELLKTSSKNSIAGLSGVKDALSSGNMIEIAARRDGNAEVADKAAAMQVQWVTASVKIVESKAINVEARIMKGDGEIIPVKGMQPINPAVLAYMPSNTVFALGGGLTPDFDWSMLGKLAMMTGDFQTQAMLSAAMPYLTAINGTAIVAAAPITEEAYTSPDPANTQFVVMAHMPQEKINELLGMIRGMCFTNGITPEVDEKTGVMCIKMFGLHLWLGNIDGYFAASTRPFSTDNNNSLAPVFTGKNGAGVLDIPTLRIFSPTLPEWGVRAELQVETESSRLQVTLPGSEGRILQNILTALLH